MGEVSAVSLPPGTAKLPVHGFVLAGGGSTRMGRDKALLRLGGVPLAEIAVRRMCEFCAAVSVVGNRGDLVGLAPVVPEARLGVGPGAGLEAGLAASTQPWALFTPVDVPGVRGWLLRRWAEAVLGLAGAGGERNGPARAQPPSQSPCGASFLRVGEDRQPAFAMLRVGALRAVTAALDTGERRLAGLLRVGAASLGQELWIPEAAVFALPPALEPSRATVAQAAQVAQVAQVTQVAQVAQVAQAAQMAQVARWFRNLNTPEEFAAAEADLAAG